MGQQGRQLLRGLDATGFCHFCCDLALHHLAEHGNDIVPQVLSVQHLPPLGIDHFTLGVHHIVIFQNVLSGPEVPSLYVSLGRLHCVGENLLINGGILVNAQGLHHPHDPLRTEEAHHVILQAQVEPALAWVPLPAGTTTELVVNPPGLMPLGTDDEQSPCCPNLVGLGGNLLLVGGQQCLILTANLQNFRIVCLGVGVGLSQQLLWHLLLPQVIERQVFRIAAQHNIRTTASHVGCDGHCPQLTGLGHNLSFLFMVLGVQHRMGTFSRFSIRDTSSLFSIEMVPTSTGCPLAWHSCT